MISDNFYGEMLLKELGAKIRGRGTTLAGTRVVRAELVERGVTMTGLHIVDGSGLSAYDKLTARAVGQLHNDCDEKHRDGSWQSEQIEAKRTKQVERDSHNARGGYMADVHVPGDLFLLRIHLVVLARLQPALAGQMRILLSDIIQQTR